MEVCSECPECVVFTPPARKPLDGFASNEHPICALSRGVYLPNFIWVGLGVRYDKLPTNFGRKKRKKRNTKKERKSIMVALRYSRATITRNRPTGSVIDGRASPAATRSRAVDDERRQIRISLYRLPGVARVRIKRSSLRCDIKEPDFRYYRPSTKWRHIWIDDVRLMSGNQIGLKSVHKWLRYCVYKLFPVLSPTRNFSTKSTSRCRKW